MKRQPSGRRVGLSERIAAESRTNRTRQALGAAVSPLGTVRPVECVVFKWIYIV